MRLGRQLGRRWIVDLGAELAQQAALPVTSGNPLRLLRAGVGFRRALGRNASLRFAYDRLQQTGGSLAYRPGNHNRVLLSFEHSFMWPLGK
jgi:hypothetical protein